LLLFNQVFNAIVFDSLFRVSEPLSAFCALSIDAGSVWALRWNIPLARSISANTIGLDSRCISFSRVHDEDEIADCVVQWILWWRT
jgi:hypothetical protein